MGIVFKGTKMRGEVEILNITKIESCLPLKCISALKKFYPKIKL